MNRCAHLPKGPILPCKRHVRFWVLSPEDYKEPEVVFKKVGWDKVGFEAKIIFLTKVHRHKSALRKGERFGHFSQVTWCPQSLGRLFVLFPILCFLSNCRVFSRLLKYMRELYSRISCVVQDNWMLLLTYCENAWSYRVLN